MTHIETPDNWKDLKPNRWCEEFSAAGASDQERLRDSLLVEGFKSDDIYRIILFREEGGAYSILDGRTRHALCIDLDREGLLKSAPRFFVWEPENELDTPWLFVIRTNSDRRHLSSSQIAALIRKDPRKERLQAEGLKAMKSGKSADGTAGGRGRKNHSVSATPGFAEPPIRKTSGKLAKLGGTNAAAVEQCDRLAKSAPDLLERVERGEMGSSSAVRILALRKSAPELAEAVVNGATTLAEGERKAISMGLRPEKKRRLTPSPAPLHACQGERQAGVATRGEHAAQGASEGFEGELPEGWEAVSPWGGGPLCQTTFCSDWETRHHPDIPQALTLGRHVAIAAHAIANHWDEEGYTDLILRLAHFATEKTKRAVINHYNASLKG